MLSCPHCNLSSSKVIYYGKQNGKTRYKCKGCSKTFSNNKLKLRKKDICRMSLHLLLEGYQVEVIATFFGVNKFTIENWKNKYLRKLADLSHTATETLPEVGECFNIVIAKPKKLGPRS